MHPSRSVLNTRVEDLRCNHTSGALNLALEAIDLAGAWKEAGMDLHVLAAQLERMHPAIATVRNVGRLLLEDPSTAWRRLEDLAQSLRGGESMHRGTSEGTHRTCRDDHYAQQQLHRTACTHFPPGGKRLRHGIASRKGRTVYGPIR